MHRLLKRQLKRYIKQTEDLPPLWDKFCTAVSDAYDSFDSDRLMVERSMELSSQELLEVNAQMRAAIPDLFLRLDHDGTVLDYKPGSATDVYVALDNPIGQPIQDFVPVDVVKQFTAALQKIHDGESLVSFEHFLEIDEEDYYYEVRLLRLHSKQAITIVRDITTRKRAEQGLKKAKETALLAAQRSDAANLAKSQFLAKMSHELRTPLNAILGFSQLMSRDESLKTDQREYLQIINHSGSHLLGLINDILDLSKIEAGEITLSKQSFDLHNLLKSVMAMLQMKATEKGLTLNFVLDPEVPQWVETDEGKLRQVLINLLNNAIKFTAKGKVELSVVASGVDLEDNLGVTFAVMDTGQGIPAEEIKTLFEPFIQSRMNRDFQEGTGLGLAISQQFTQMMGGEITVMSDLGQGSRFAFTLPIARATSGSTAIAPPRRKVVGLAPDQPDYRILIVEDRLENSRLLEKLLTMVGFEVNLARNGIEAIQQWQDWQPDLIWMDIHMPVMDGYEATRHIREQEEGQSQAIPILALTASAFEEDRKLVLDAGCTDFLRKPFDEHKLFAKMADYLGLSYIYAEEESAASNGSHHPGNASQTTSETEAKTVDPKVAIAAHLERLSNEQREQLYQLTLQADSEAIAELLDSWDESFADLSRQILDWVNNYQFEELFELLE